MHELYRQYLCARGATKYERSISDARDDLVRHAADNPDYHTDTLRNGDLQPFILTRGGEEHTYNVICLPGDELYAGDLISAFGQMWLVMEARSDDTTHRTGIMQQCNKKFRFQNFTSEILEYWGYVDQSGYSSSVTGTNQIQKAEEQFAVYLPYNADTAKIYVDKRLASHTGYDKFGHKMLSTFRVTSCSPVTKSFNSEDHLLSLKVIQDVYSPTQDNLELEICDYIAPSSSPSPLPSPDPKMLCKIVGNSKILLGRSRTYKVVFVDAEGNDDSDRSTPVWDYPSIDGITFALLGKDLKISVQPFDKLIGTEFAIGVQDDLGLYERVSVTVEVGNIA